MSLRPFRRACLPALLLLLGPAALRALSPCTPEADHLCLQGGRFQAEVAWRAPGFGSGVGKSVPLSGDTGAFWFFANNNLELVVKVLDGRPINRHFWVFYGGLSDVEYTLTVTDTQTGLQEVYQNPAGHLASASDVTAFGEEAPAALSKAVRAAAPAPPPPPLRLGPEFQVNVTTADNQWSPAVAVAPDGGFAVSWLGTPGLWIRFYDPAGSPRGGEIRLDESSIFPAQARMAADTSGRFMVVWDELSGIWARFFDAQGHPQGAAVRIAGGPPGFSTPDVASTSGDGFLATWREVGPSPNGPDRLHTQRFSGLGVKVGNENQFSLTGRLGYLRTATLPPDGYLVAWSVIGSTASDVLAQRLDAAGQTVGGVVPVALQSPGIAQGVAPAGHPGGAFSVVWVNGVLGQPALTGLFGRRFAPDGTPAGEAVRIHQGNAIVNSLPEAVGLPSGDTWALWYEYNDQDPDGGVFAGLFDASWNTRGITRVNTYTRDYQSQPAAAASPGGVVAAWSSGLNHSLIPVPPDVGLYTQDGSFLGVFAQRFTTANCAPDPGQLCLNGRFRVEVQLTDPRTGQAGAATAIPLTSDTGGFWFFDAANVELMIKVLDGREVNGHFWVFYGALSDVPYTITITDTATGQSKVYRNPAGQLASRSDTAAF